MADASETKEEISASSGTVEKDHTDGTDAAEVKSADPPQENEDSEEKEEKPIKWCETLKSPKSEEIFSPSRDGLHGFALLKATDRAKKLTRSGRQCANIIYDVAGLYDTLATNLLRALSGLPLQGHPVAQYAGAVHKSLQSIAKQTQGLAICLRGSVARPLHSSLQSMGETAPSIYSRYSASRQRCQSARQAALKMRLRYVKAVRDAEVALQELKEAKDAAGTTNASSNGSEDSATPSEQSDRPQENASPSSKAKPAWEMRLRQIGRKYGIPSTADRVILCLVEVQSLEKQYIQLVKDEKAAVSQADTLEAMGLESIQHLESERQRCFVESISRSVQAEKGALEKMIVSFELDANQKEEVHPLAPPTLEKKKEPQDFLRNLLKTNNASSDEDVGVMEAESAGLPEELGVLRDKVKAALRARESRAVAVKAVVSCLEDVAVASINSATGMNNRLGQDGFGPKLGKTVDQLDSALAQTEGLRVCTYWNSLMKSLDEFSIDARGLAQSLRKSRHQYFDTFVLRGDKELKNLSDAADTRWKQVCEAARAETRAQLRYQQATQNFEKARNRVKSIDQNDDGDTGQAGNRARSQSSGAKINKNVSKALGNMMSILPNGGEGAMNIMGEDARRAITQAKFTEAEQRETKGRSSLESATQAKERAIVQYKQSAQIMIENMRKEDDEGWSDIIKTLESLVGSYKDFHTSRFKSIATLTDKCPTEAGMDSDIRDWTSGIHEELKSKIVHARNNSGMQTVNSCYSLKVELVKSTRVYKVLSYGGVDDEDSDMTDDTEDLVDAGKNEVPVPPSPKLSQGDGVPDTPDSSRLMKRPELRLSHSAAVTPEPRGSPRSETNTADTEIFILHFWSDRATNEAPPTVIESFSAAYWPKTSEGYISPLLHGRIFLTKDKFYFVGWSDKKIVVDWSDVTAVTKEKNLMGTIDNSLKLTAMVNEKDISYFFGSFAAREAAFLLMDRLSTVARTISEIQGKNAPKKMLLLPLPGQTAPPVPPDATMKKMEKIMTKKLKNISIQKFYEVVWSEGCKTDAEPLYGPWLIEMGSQKVKVSEWDFEGHTNSWCGEKYDQMRTIDFEFKRTTHLYIGPPIAQVRQTQYCRTEGNDKCVLHMTLGFEGIPYSDCFGVEVRWVARRDGANDITIDVGCFVQFLKSTMFASKIRAGTISETKPVHEQLFARVREACAKSTGEDSNVVDEEAQEEVTDEAIEDAEADTKAETGLTLLGVSLNDFFKPKGAVGKISTMDASTFAIGFIGLFVVWRIVRFLLGSSGARPSETAIQELTLKVDELSNEVETLKGTLAEILSLVKEIKGQGVENVEL